MKKDIQFPKVEDVAVAVVPAVDGSGVWEVYLLHLADRILENVMITSSGYGEKDGRKVETSRMRHRLGTVKGQKAVAIESIIEEVFAITNEFWVSFWCNNQLYDKKYIFVSGSIHPNNFTEVPLLGRKGVMIR